MTIRCEPQPDYVVITNDATMQTYRFKGHWQFDRWHAADKTWRPADVANIPAEIIHAAVEYTQ